MERSLDADFGDVRIHSGSPARRLNEDLGAKAFTTGRDIFFREGKPSFETTAGWQLIAHELTHVAQQAGAVRGGHTAAGAQAVQLCPHDEARDSSECQACNDEEWARQFEWPDDDYDDPGGFDEHTERALAFEEDYYGKASRGRKGKQRSKVTSPPKREDRHKNLHSSHKQLWAAETNRIEQAATSEAEENPNRVSPPEPAPSLDEVRRGYRPARQPMLSQRAEYEAPEVGKRRAIAGFPKEIGKQVLGNVMRGEAPLRPEKGKHGKVSWATVTHHGNEELPSRPYSGRDDPQNALANFSYDMGEQDRHISEDAVRRVYDFHATKATRHSEKLGGGVVSPQQHDRIKRQAGVRTWKTLGTHGEGTGMTSMDVPGNHPLSEKPGQFVVMPQASRNRMSIEGRESYDKPHSRRPRHADKDRSDIGAFARSLGSGGYESVNDAPEEEFPPLKSRPMGKKEKRRPRNSGRGKGNFKP